MIWFTHPDVDLVTVCGQKSRITVKNSWQGGPPRRQATSIAKWPLGNGLEQTIEAGGTFARQQKVHTIVGLQGRRRRPGSIAVRRIWLAAGKRLGRILSTSVVASGPSAGERRPAARSGLHSRSGRPKRWPPC